jgi:hypothetical protein|tara:strand:+ start:7563 stop:7859 length:297 start_codon:yes stop_codon:yes gene_type:complete
MGTVTINASGVGGTQSGTVTTAAGSGAGSIMVTNDSDARITFNVATGGTDVQTGLTCAEKSFLIVTGLDNGAQTLTSLKTAHGTSAQNGEIVYNTLIA